MRRVLAAMAVSAVAGCQLTAGLNTPESRAQLAISYPDLIVEDVRSAPIGSLLEVYSQGRIVYYAPKEDLLLLGDVYGPEGHSLTQTRRAAWIGERAAALDLSKAITVGQGPSELTAFVDPNCGHCREAIAWFERSEYAGFRVHFFFLPIAPQTDAYARAVQAACAPASLRREAMRQVFGQSRAGIAQPLRCAEGEALLAAQAEVVKSIGIQESPVFIARGQTVRGFYPDRLEALLWSRNPFTQE